MRGAAGRGGSALVGSFCSATTGWRMVGSRAGRWDDWRGGGGRTDAVRRALASSPAGGGGTTGVMESPLAAARASSAGMGAGRGAADTGVMEM